MGKKYDAATLQTWSNEQLMERGRRLKGKKRVLGVGVGAASIHVGAAVATGGASIPLHVVAGVYHVHKYARADEEFDLIAAILKESRGIEWNGKGWVGVGNGKLKEATKLGALSVAISALG